MPSEVLKKPLFSVFVGPVDCAAATDADTMHRRTTLSVTVVFLFIVRIRLKAILRIIPLLLDHPSWFAHLGPSVAKPCRTATFSRDTVPRFRTYRASSLLRQNRRGACARAFRRARGSVRRTPEDKRKARELRRPWCPRAEESA